MIDYLFYRIHKIFYSAHGQTRGAVLAMMTFCLIIFINLLTILNFLEAFRILPVLGLAKYHAYVIVLFLFIPGYFVFIRKKRYVEIENRFKTESHRDKEDGRSKVMIYILVSGIAFFIAAVLRYNVIHHRL